jgi:hypothetical protein
MGAKLCVVRWVLGALLVTAGLVLSGCGGGIPLAVESFDSDGGGSSKPPEVVTNPAPSITTPATPDLVYVKFAVRSARKEPLSARVEFQVVDADLDLIQSKPELYSAPSPPRRAGERRHWSTLHPEGRWYSSGKRGRICSAERRAWN